MSLRNHSAALRKPIDLAASSGPIGDWGKLFGNISTPTAILARFLPCATMLTLQGRS